MFTWFVFINNSESRIGLLKAGVPQGSVLDPLLFLIYINDISDNLSSLVRLFADDTSLSYSSTNLLQIERKLNYNINILNTWAEKWLVKFNPQKTEFVIFSNKKNIEPVTILAASSCRHSNFWVSRIQQSSHSPQPYSNISKIYVL
jgi:hypothetical protein